jgi:hypothetical protein
MEKSDHDLLIEINADTKHIRKDLTECNEKYNRLRKDVDFHDRLLNKMKGATVATTVFLTALGAALLYLFFR